MIILTAAAIAAAQPAPAPQAPMAPMAHPAGQHAGHGPHAPGQQAHNCPCCAQHGSTQDRDGCAGHRQLQHRDHGASR